MRAPDHFLVQVDVTKRWSAEELLQHPFLETAAPPTCIAPLIRYRGANTAPPRGPGSVAPLFRAARKQMEQDKEAQG